MRRVCFKKIFPLLLALVLMSAVGITGLAAEDMPDLSKTGSVTVTMLDSDSGKAVAGGTLTLYQVGDVIVENGYSFQLTDAFSGSNLPLNDVESERLAEDLAAYAETEKITGTSAEIGKDGKAVFPELEPGLYLVRQRDAAKGYYAVSSFLVSVPVSEADGYVYDVDATPKMERLSAIPQTPDKPGTTVTPGKTGTKVSLSKLPQTGQLNWPIPVLVFSGLLLFAVGWMLISRRSEGQVKKCGKWQNCRGSVLDD